MKSKKELMKKLIIIAAILAVTTLHAGDNQDLNSRVAKLEETVFISSKATYAAALVARAQNERISKLEAEIQQLQKRIDAMDSSKRGI